MKIVKRTTQVLLSLLCVWALGVFSPTARSEEGLYTTRDFSTTVYHQKPLKKVALPGFYEVVHPFLLHMGSADDSPGIAETNVRIFHFREHIEAAEALPLIEAAGYQPATAHELVAFDSQHPEFLNIATKHIALVAFGTLLNARGGKCTDSAPECFAAAIWIDPGNVRILHFVQSDYAGPWTHGWMYVTVPTSTKRGAI